MISVTCACGAVGEFRLIEDTVAAKMLYLAEVIKWHDEHRAHLPGQPVAPWDTRS